MPLDIDQQDGTITLPNGIVVQPSLTQDELRASPLFAAAKSQDRGTLPWIHYSFSGGQIEEKDLFVNLCFYDQMLVFSNISANLYPPGPWDWSQYSLDVEAGIKHFHDDLLTRMLGQPAKTTELPNHGLPKQHTILARPLEWKFPWGNVSSSHDFNGGGTQIYIGFGKRHEQARVAYLSRK